MSERMKVGELAAIYSRCRRATPGPWVACRDHAVIGGIGGPVCQMDEDDAIVVGQAGDFGPTNDPWDDAEFIAHARSDVPRLLAEVQRVRMELAGCRARMEAVTRKRGGRRVHFQFSQATGVSVCASV